MGEKIKNSELYLGFLQLKETTKNMTFLEKIQHILISYKIEICLILMLLLIAVFVVSCFISVNTGIMISGDLMDLHISDEGLAYLTDAYLEKLGGETFTQKFQIEKSYYTDDGIADDHEDNYQTSTQIIARVSAGFLDFQVIKKATLEIFLKNDFYLDLREFLTEEELAQWEGRILYTKYEGSDESIPVALDLSDTAFAKDCMPKNGPYFFTVIKTTPRLEQCRDFMNHLLAWEGKDAAAAPAA